MTSLSNIRKCSWCDLMVDSEECFAHRMERGGWECSACGKQLAIGGVEHTHSQPSTPQESEGGQPHSSHQE